MKAVDEVEEVLTGSYTVIFPFINQMVEELGITDNPDKVGFYSGLVVSPGSDCYASCRCRSTRNGPQYDAHEHRA